MTLQEAFKSCGQGNIVSHSSFDQSQSMHYFNGEFYYEDGACLTGHIAWMESQEWAQQGWYVKYTAVASDCPAKIIATIHHRTSIFEGRHRTNV